MDPSGFEPEAPAFLLLYFSVNKIYYARAMLYRTELQAQNYYFGYEYI